MSQRPHICFIVGNIGTGKSTFLDQLRLNGNFNAQYIQEPVDKWLNTKDSDGKNILEHFYSDMETFCYMFQSFAFITRVSQFDEITNTYPIVFIERSIFCDRNVFAKTAYETGKMKEIEWITYTTWFDHMVKKYQQIFDNASYLYLRCSPLTSLKRIQERARGEETSISLEYLETLHQKHEEWLMNDPKTIILSAEKDLRDKSNLLDIQKQILKELPINFKMGIMKSPTKQQIDQCLDKINKHKEMTQGPKLV